MKEGTSMVIIKHKKSIFFAIILNILAFLTTTYFFISPAQSHTSQDNLICLLDAHSHTDECFAPYPDDYTDKILICGITAENDKISHIHDSFCYDSMNNLICPVEEYVHTHELSCFNENNEQICGFIVHQHSEQCFSDMVNKEDYRLLICSQGAHTHIDSCYEMHTQEETTVSEDVQPEDIQNENIQPEEVQNEDVLPEDIQVQNYDIQLMSDESENQPETSGAENAARTFDTSNAIDLEQQENNSYKYIENITVSYQESGKWIQIKNENGNNQNLPADADYRLEVFYKDIKVSNLKSHGGKLMLSGLPSWLKPDQNGKILYNSVPVASMQVDNTTLLITFDSNYMTDHLNDTLSGSFFVRGSVDWRELVDNKGEIHLPTLDMTINFEDNLKPKYGQFTIDKLEPKLKYDNNGYYLEYKLKVKSNESLESNVTIPDVTVKDFFTRSGEYIEEYCGITEGGITPGNAENGFNPFETSTKDNFTHGTVVKNADSMLWTIGDLQPQEERILTYYAKLDPSYIGSFSKGSIVNSAEAYSSEIPRGSNSSEFIPIANAWIKKGRAIKNITDEKTGTGTITYTIEVSADENNSYDLTNLKIHDFVDPKFSGFVTYPDQITTASNKNITVTNYGEGATSFDINIPTLEPGEVITITYVMNVENILLAGTGTIDLINKAELLPDNQSSGGAAPGYTFGSSQDHQTFTQSQWMRKLDGGDVPETVVEANSGVAYKYDESDISDISETSLPGTFTIPAGSKKYQVILNEEGRWDLSSSTMKDKFHDGSGIIYKGWLCIQEYNNTGITGQPNDSEALEKINQLSPAETVWLNIDGRDEFSFIPSQLGLDHKYTYLLTYYAGIQNADNAGTVAITNDFMVSGIIVGGTPYHINGIKISVSSLIQGNIHYNVHKDSWYYSEHPGDEDKVDLDKSNYGNGALYWVIKVDGDINQGFRVKDAIQNIEGINYSHSVCSDSIAGVYKGKKGLDFTNEFNTYSQMLGYVNGSGDKALEKLNGNTQNPGYNPSVVYNQFPVTNISDLDGQSFIIANFNWHPGVLINQLGNYPRAGLKGNKTINYVNNINEPPIRSASNLTKWTFEKVNDNENDTFYIYSNVNGIPQYISITGGETISTRQGDVSLSDEPVVLHISQNSEKIKITNEHNMALNWYGSDNAFDLFSGYKADDDDVNDFHTLLKPSDNYNAADDYSWFSENQNDGIEVCFQKDMNLEDDEALYIVVRTSPSYKPQMGWGSGIYQNSAASKLNGSSELEWATANNAELIQKVATPVFKEGFKGYEYNGTNWLDNTNAHLTHIKDSPIHLEPGFYAEWIINVNWDGSMEGLAEVSDIIPENFTPAFVCQNWLPDIINNTPSMKPTYPTIPELESDRNWIKMQQAEIPYYFNPTTRELKFCVDNLQKESDPLAVNSRTVNIQLFCKVEDPDILLSGGTTEVDNTATVTNNGKTDKSTGTVSISPNCSLTKEFGGNINESGKTGDDLLKFVITVNPYRETLGTNNFLPPLVDQFSNKLIIKESSLEIRENDEEGELINGYTYNIEGQKLTITNLPDNKKIYITYNARTTAEPDKDNDIHVSNRAYWEGHKPPEVWQVNDLVIDLSMGGNVDISSTPSVAIYKVDSADRSERLQGAEFKLYKYKGNTDQTDKLIGSGETGDNGKLDFNSENLEDELQYNTVYYITETKAPDGYEHDPNKKYYFAILNGEISTYPDFSNFPELVKWDAKRYGTVYECMIENEKGKIQVNKSFTDENSNNPVPVSGKFYFGIFGENPQTKPNATLLQTLEIEYVDRDANYKLDGKTVSEPKFNIAKPNETYYVFELDESNKPILNNNYFSANGKTYKVIYSPRSGTTTPDNMVTISNDYNVISIENQTVYFALPDAGGIGLKKYYLIAGLFLITAALIASKFILISKKHRTNSVTVKSHVTSNGIKKRV